MLAFSGSVDMDNFYNGKRTFAYLKTTELTKSEQICRGAVIKSRYEMILWILKNSIRSYVMLNYSGSVDMVTSRNDPNKNKKFQGFFHFRGSVDMVNF